MAIGEITLVFIGTLATLASIGIFVNFQDAEINMFLGMLGAVLWGVFAISSFNVITAVTDSTVRTESITQLVIVGVALSAIMFLFTVYTVFEAFRSQSQAKGVDFG